MRPCLHHELVLLALTKTKKKALSIYPLFPNDAGSILSKRSTLIRRVRMTQQCQMVTMQRVCAVCVRSKVAMCAVDEFTTKRY